MQNTPEVNFRIALPSSGVERTLKEEFPLPAESVGISYFMVLKCLVHSYI